MLNLKKRHIFAKIFRSCRCGLAGFLCLISSVAAAEVQFAQSPQKADILIPLEASVDYEVEAKDAELLLSFSQPMADMLTATSKQLPLFVQAQKLSPDKKAIRLAMKNPYSVRTLNANGILQIEIVPQTNKAPKNNAGGNKILLDFGQHEDFLRMSFAFQNRPHYAVKTDKNATIISFMTPVEFDWSKVRDSDIYPFIEQFSNPLGGTDLKIPNKLLKSFEYNDKIVLDFVPNANLSTPKAEVIKSQNIVGRQTQLAQADENVVKKDEVVSLAFPWNMEVGVSVFQRGKYIWVAFDRQRNLDLDELRFTSRSLVEQIVQVPHTKATILRITPKKDVRVGLRQEGLLWIVDLYTHNVDYKVKEMPIYVQYNSMQESYLYIPTESGGNSLSIIDPEVGDVILIGTETELGMAINEDYHYQDLEILSAKQGFALVPNASDIMLLKGNSGFTIKADNRSLNISDNLDTLKRQQQFLQKASDVFDLSIPAQLLWLNFNEAEQQLKQDINNASLERRVEAKLLLIRYYLGMGLGTEAKHMLKDLTPAEKNKIRPETLAALTGVSNFLMRRYDEALDNFSHPALQNNNEAVFWRALTDAALEFKKENDAVLLTFVSVIRDYPQELKERIALVALDTTTRAYDDISTQNFLDILKDSKESDAHRSQILFLNAQNFEYQGYPNNALKEYGFAAMRQSQKYASLARYKKMDLQVKLNLTSPQKAIEEFERLRFAWGEPQFKFDLLQRLAEVYVLDKNYYKALLTYKQSLDLAPTPAQKNAVLEKMINLFEDLFINGRIDELQAVKAIALYKDFDWLAPRSKYYTAIALKLADRMVAVDLLTSATDLLKEQLRLVNLSDEQKAQVGVRLALIYLFENDSIAALDILNSTDAPHLPKNHQQYRKIIKAKALAYLNKTDEALALLDDDYSKNALLLKTDIYWKSAQWSKAADTIKFLIEKPQNGKALSSEQMSYILDWITALKKANRNTVIYRIRNTFLPFFKGTAFESTFNVLTTNLETNRVDMNSIDKAVSDIAAYSNFSKIYDESLLKTMPQQPKNQ